MAQTVEFVALVEKTVAFEYTESFEFRKDRPAHWLQKLCLFTLRKLKAFHFGKTISVERHTVDAKSFMERLWKQNTTLHSYFNLKPSILLIGSEDYADLMQDKLINQHISFSTEYWVQERRTGLRDPHEVCHRPTVLGLTVHVVPWMRGCVPLTNDQVKEIWVK